MKCLLCGEPVIEDVQGSDRWVHLFTGQAECTYKAHL